MGRGWELARNPGSPGVLAPHSEGLPWWELLRVGRVGGQDAGGWGGMRSFKRTLGTEGPV